MISNTARGSIFLGFSLLLAVFFCFQPRVEAESNSTNDLQQKFNQDFYQTDIPPNDLINEQLENESINELVENLQTKTSSSILENEIKTETKAVSASRAFRATAYCLQGRTATGGGVRRGIVAADPRVLPLGTRVEISAGSYSGTYTVADTGGAVRGRVLDVWVPTCAEATRFGRKTVMVSVVDKRAK